MPSRAVLRKKARRESKRQKQLQSNQTNNVYIDRNGNTKIMSAKPTNMNTATTAEEVQCDASVTLPSVAVAKIVESVCRSNKFCESVQRKRNRESTNEQDIDDKRTDMPWRKLTHKQRVKMAAQAKLEKEIMRLNAISARAEVQKRQINSNQNTAATIVASKSKASAHGRENAENSTRNEAEASHNLHSITEDTSTNHFEMSTSLENSNQVSNAVVESSSTCISMEQESLHCERAMEQESTNSDQISHLTSLESKPRHDPRFVNGTFWRNRKEKRARTLFLGGMPSTYSVQEIEEFIDKVVRKDSNAGPYLKELAEGEKVVEHVDFLPLKHGSKVRHMFVVMASVPLTGCASLQLDGMRINQHALRCNFAADKTQRAEAIRRRAGPQKQELRR